jgi:mono/diheme cytochrome c family protein
MKIFYLLFLFLLGPVYAYGQTSDNIENGAAVYYDYACYSCHGYNGTGRTRLTEGASGIITNEDIFISFLRQRSELNPTLPSTRMPNYDSSTLSDEQARDVYAYIKTFKDNPPEVEDDPLMQAILEAARK